MAPAPIAQPLSPGPGNAFGEAVQGAEAAQAERRVVEGLKRMAWTTEADLSARPKGEAQLPFGHKAATLRPSHETLSPSLRRRSQARAGRWCALVAGSGFSR